MLHPVKIVDPADLVGRSSTHVEEFTPVGSLGSLVRTQDDARVKLCTQLPTLQATEQLLVYLTLYLGNLCKDGVPEASIETELLLDVENADAAEEILSKESFEGSGTVTFFNNMERVVSGMRALILLIEIFVYGFILVISLIGLTNIFNTITNNIKLRQKEFATLLSIGTTKKEFNRMVGLESLLYTVKSLLIGLPLGLGAGVVIYLMYGQTLGGMSYIFPWKAVLISILVVLILLWVIMRFSIRKVSKMNVIETIRNDNI